MDKIKIGIPSNTGDGYNIEEFKKKTSYERLGIRPGASADEIKKAYRKAAFDFHPDRHPGDKLAEEKFKLVAEAYEMLTSGSGKKMNSVHEARDYFEKTFGFTKEEWETLKNGGFVIDDTEVKESHDKLFGKPTSYKEVKKFMNEGDFFGKKQNLN